MDISNKREVEQQIEDISPNEQLNQLDSIYGRKLQSPILGHRYQIPDLSKNHVSCIILDTSLLHIPVYTHLKVYDLKPVHRPRMPSILSTLQLSEDIALISKSSKEISSTARISEEDQISASYNIKNSVRIE